jgi:hypothetical protein
MERLEGETLKHRLSRGPVPLTELLEWSGQIADALNAAHNVHRDIKPLAPDGNHRLGLIDRLRKFGQPPACASERARARDWCPARCNHLASP